MKTIFTLLTLTATVGIFIAVSAWGSGTVKSSAAALPHGGMSAKEGVASPHGVVPAGMTVAAMPPGHSPAIPADTNLVNSGEVLEVIDSPMYTYLQVASDKGPALAGSLQGRHRQGGGCQVFKRCSDVGVLQQVAGPHL